MTPRLMPVTVTWRHGATGEHHTSCQLWSRFAWDTCMESDDADAWLADSAARTTAVVERVPQRSVEVLHIQPD